MPTHHKREKDVLPGCLVPGFVLPATDCSVASSMCRTMSRRLEREQAPRRMRLLSPPGIHALLATVATEALSSVLIPRPCFISVSDIHHLRKKQPNSQPKEVRGTDGTPAVPGSRDDYPERQPQNFFPGWTFLSDCPFPLCGW